MVEVLLRHKGYEVLAPCLPEPVWGNRRGRPEPLFPGYVFCKLCEPSQGLVVATPGVLRFAGPGGRPEPVPSDEIAAIQTVLASGLPIRPAAMQPGCAVELVAGPLNGCRGTLVECTTRGRVLIGVSLLQRAISVVVEREWLQPLPVKPNLPQSRNFAAQTFDLLNLCRQASGPVIPHTKSRIRAGKR